MALLFISPPALLINHFISPGRNERVAKVFLLLNRLHNHQGASPGLLANLHDFDLAEARELPRAKKKKKKTVRKREVFYGGKWKVMNDKTGHAPLLVSR